MTTALTAGYTTLVDLASVLRDNDLGEPISILAESNPILQDANVMETNTPNGHVSIWESTLPSGTWRGYNQRITASKGTTKQVKDIWGNIEALNDIDKDLAERSGNVKKFRYIQDNLHISGLNNDVAEALFTANASLDPEKFHGLQPRYNSTSTGDYYNNVYSAGGSGDDNTSMWMITWGPTTCSLIYPPGSSAGLQITDNGLIRDSNSNGVIFYYETHFQWKLGLAIIDPRYVTRGCNIDVSDLSEDSSSGADLLQVLRKMYMKRPTANLGQNIARTFIYCNPTVWDILWAQSSNKGNVQLTQGNAGGQPFLMWNGIPIHVCDAILNTEATVS